MNGENPNFWGFLLITFRYLSGKTTRLLGIAQGVLAIVAAQDNLLTHKQLAALLLVSAILTYLRGQFVSGVVEQAKAVVAASPKVTVASTLESKVVKTDGGTLLVTPVPLVQPPQEKPK